MEMRSSNPVLNRNFWSNLTGNDRMTLEGSLRKIGYLLSVTILTALVSAVLCINAINNGSGALVVTGLMGLGFMGGFIIALLIFFMRPENPAALMSLYAIFQGFAIGAFSLYFESLVDGVVLQAAFGTVGITATMYIMYACLLYTSPSPRDATLSRMPSSA